MCAIATFTTDTHTHTHRLAHTHAHILFFLGLLARAKHIA